MRSCALCAVLFGAIFAADAQESPVALQDPLEGQFRARETTLADQTNVAVTIYNNDLGLVRDTRKIALFPGEMSLTFSDVAQLIMPETVSLQSISNPGALRILEQNYEYDLISPSKLMEKYVGKRVDLVAFSEELGFQRKEAQLLSVNEGPIYQVGDEIFLGHPGTVVLPEIPENLIAKPSLIWLLDNQATDQTVEVTYLTRGLSWKADYVVTLDRSDTSMNVDAWVTLNNNSGTAYQEAKLKLVAGDVNIVSQAPEIAMDKMVRFEAAAQAAPMMEEAFAEYHLYTLPRPTTIKENQSKQVSLFTAQDAKTKKVYEYRGQLHFYSSRIEPIRNDNVAVTLVFENDESNNLGMPLPGGVMRIYQEDSEGALQFAGEDRIQHTPNDEEVRLNMGKAFDVVGERTQTEFRVISDRVFETAFEVVIRNHKDAAIVVDVVEPMPADWEILNASHEHVKKDAHTAVFSLPVPANGETELTYRVRLRF